MMSRIVPIAWLLTAAILIGASIGLAARANATPADDYAAMNAATICYMLDQNPTTSTIEALVSELQSKGWGLYEAGYIVGSAIYGLCPEHDPEARAYISQATGRVAA